MCVHRCNDAVLRSTRRVAPPLYHTPVSASGVAERNSSLPGQARLSSVVLSLCLTTGENKFFFLTLLTL